MRLVRLEVRNFKRLGRNGWVMVDFPEEGVIAIVGENEAGKSTLADAILYALTGKTRGMMESSMERKERAEEVISWGASSAEVKLKFRVGDAEYAVYRRRTSSGGTARLTGRNAEGWKKVNSIISELISGMNADMLAATVFSAQKDTDRPVKLKSNERRGLITHMLGMGKWDEAKKDLEERRREINGEKRKVESDLDSIGREIEGIKRAVEGLEDKRKELAKVESDLKEASQRTSELGKRKGELEKEVKEYKKLEKDRAEGGKDLEVKRANLKNREKRREELKEEISKLEDELKKKRSLINSKKREIRKLESDAKRLSSPLYTRVPVVTGLLLLALGVILGIVSPVGLPIVLIGLLAVVTGAYARKVAFDRRREANRLRDELETIVPEEGSLEDKRRALTRIEKDIISLRREIGELQTKLEDLKRKMDSIKQKVGGDPGELLDQVKQELSGLDERVKHLSEQKKKLEEEIKKIEEDKKRLDELERELNEKKAKLEELNKEFRITELAIELIGKVVDSVWRSVAPSIETNMGKFLSRITLGRYYRVKVGEEDWSIKVYVPERAAAGQDPYVSMFRMSGGTQDQVTLALRLAVITSLVGRGANWPEFLILDEVLGATDERRREGVMELLKSLRRQFPQIIMITHQEDVAEMADVVVRVEDGRVEVQNVVGASDGSGHA